MSSKVRVSVIIDDKLEKLLDSYRKAGVDVSAVVKEWLRKQSQKTLARDGKKVLSRVG